MSGTGDEDDAAENAALHEQVERLTSENHDLAAVLRVITSAAMAALTRRDKSMESDA